MTRILVADDEVDLELLIKQKFRKEIRNGIFDFVFALNGREALHIIQHNKDIDLVLSDINMPEMDGLTLLSRLNEVAPLTKTVMVSAYGDLDNIRSAMNKGAFDFVFKPIDFEDLRTTIDKTLVAVQHIKDKIRAVRENDILKMYVDESVLKYMDSGQLEETFSSCETIEATVAFIDICGFTTISEIEPADQVVELLNQYFDIMVKEIINQDGMIDKFIGDAIMAVFRGPHHLDRAIESSIAIRDALKQILASPTKSGYTPRVSIGINCGEMVCGNIGSSTLKRLDYTVIGDTVNIAARMQSHADAGQILITAKAYEMVKESFNCREVAELKFKNKSVPVLVYEVLD
jgi:adenylate cyclase